jgi:hypothetical protein
MDMKPSAYRSMQLAKEGKTKKKDGNLTRWINEKWRNLTPIMLGETGFFDCGEQSDQQKKLNFPSVCRPTVKVSEKTPKLAQNFTKKQIKKAVEEKKKGNIISWSKL